jgi:hypothetical protein
MASLNGTGMGIGDFALNLLEQEKTNPQPVSRKAPVRGNVPDIENVQILQEDVDNVLANSFGIEKEAKPKRNLKEEREKQLREEIQIKLNELKELLNELGVGTTTVGSIGAPNFSGGATDGANQYSKRSKRGRAKIRRKKIR